MSPQSSTILAVLMLLGALVPGVIALRLAGRRTPGAIAPLLLSHAQRIAPVVLMLAAISTWIGGYAASLLVSAFEPSYWFHRISFLGVAATPPAILAVALETTRRKWRTVPGLAAISVIPFVTMVLALTSDFQGWLWTSAELQQVGELTPLDMTQGPWFWVHTAFSYSALGIAFVVLAMEYVRAPRDYIREGVVLGIAFLAPWVINTVYVTSDFPMALDPTPAGLLVTVLLFYRVLRRVHFADLLPVAWNTVIETLGDAIVVVDGEGKILDANRAANRLVGGGGFRKQLNALLQSGRDGAELTIVSDSEQRRSYDVRVSQVPLFLPTARIRVIAVRDVTERLLRQEEARALEKRLHHNQRLESIGLLAGGIAHDFNNLLTVILGGSEIALGELPEGHPARSSIDLAIHSSLAAADLTKELLAYAGKGSLEMQNLELGHNVKDVAALASAAMPARVRLELDLPADPIVIKGDPVQIQQVLMNLILNAAESYDGASGVVTVRIGSVDAAVAETRDLVEERELAAGEHVYIDVTDHGRGMDETTRARVFEPFYTTKSGSRGLGLAAVLGIVKSHEGAVALSSREGAGSTLRVLFPIVSRGQRAPAESEAVAVRATHARVLVVDDNPMVRSVAEDSLLGLGCSVLLAEDGHTALEIFRKRRDEIDVVLLDMTMPDLNGTQVLHAIRQQSRDLPVILSTGYTVSDIGGALNSDYTSFLAKPYTRAELANAIESAVNSSAS